MDCIIAQPEAVVLGANLLELLRSRAVATHLEAYVRRAALYAASRVIVALHPSQVVTAITDPNSNIGSGLEWVREWALGIASNDSDSDCAAVSFSMWIGFACLRRISGLITCRANFSKFSI